MLKVRNKILFLSVRYPLLAVFLSLLFTFHFSLFTAYAENPKEQYNKLQKEMESRQEKLERAKKRERSVLDDIDVINRDLASIEGDAKRQRHKTRQAESEIIRIERDIAVIQEKIDKGRTYLKRRLRAMQRYGQSTDLLFLLSATDDMSELLRRWKYLENIAMSDRKAIAEYAENLKTLERKEKQLQALRADLKRNEERLKPIEASLSEKKRDKQALLASVRTEKATQERLLRELKEASKRLLDVMKKLEERDRREKFDAKGFLASKGTLAWPVKGRVAIPYGSQRDPKFNTPVFRNGVYFKTDDETAKAVYPGKVVYADWFKGYGNLVIINHGEGYHTLYGNLSETFLKVGDIIKVMDLVGKVGESGMLNAPSLYFEVRYKGKPLDPMQWLKRK